MPADGGASIAARIDEVLPRGEFATWRAARAVGDYDLDTSPHSCRSGDRHARAAAGDDGLAGPPRRGAAGE
jgi:hypothetical protein